MKKALNTFSYATAEGTAKGAFNIYQAKNKYIQLVMGNSNTTLSEQQLFNLNINCHGLKDFDHDSYLRFYVEARKETEVYKVINGIDYPSLKEQKIHLITVINELANPEQQEGLEGILSMIDAIQDAVVADGLRDKDVVFSLAEEEEEPETITVRSTAFLHPELHSDFNAGIFTADQYSTEIIKHYCPDSYELAIQEVTGNESGISYTYDTREEAQSDMNTFINRNQ